MPELQTRRTPVEPLSSKGQALVEAPHANPLSLLAQLLEQGDGCNAYRLDAAATRGGAPRGHPGDFRRFLITPKFNSLRLSTTSGLYVTDTLCGYCCSNNSAVQ